MKRGRNTLLKWYHRRATAILTADWHLREDKPVCRTDDFWKTQWEKVRFIAELQKQHDCVVYHAGDLFNHWKPSPFLLSTTMKFLPDNMYIIYGNHDLPQHSLKLEHKSGLYALKTAKELHLYPMGHWGTQPEAYAQLEVLWRRDNRSIFLWHTMNWQGKRPWPDCTDPSAHSLLKKYAQFDLIVTGHNHKPFVEEMDGRLLVNPGSITRQAVDETHQPRVYLWFAEDNTVESVFIPIEAGAITKEHIEIKEMRDDRIQAFITKLDGDWETALDFEDNLESFFDKNKTPKLIKGIIYKALEA